jgi:hypothetical protein
MSNPPVTPPVTPPETIGQAAEQVVTDVQSDITASETAVTTAIDPLWAQARAEYDSLAPAAQARIHGLFNDLETLYSTALPALHTVLGAK